MLMYNCRITNLKILFNSIYTFPFPHITISKKIKRIRYCNYHIIIGESYEYCLDFKPCHILLSQFPNTLSQSKPGVIKTINVR